MKLSKKRADSTADLAEKAIGKMAKKFPGFYWYPLVSRFPESQKPETIVEKKTKLACL